MVNFATAVYDTIKVCQSDRYLFSPDSLSDDLKRLGPWRKEDKCLYVPGDTGLVLMDVVRSGETVVSGGEMMKRATELQCAGQGHAEIIARNNRVVPRKWHDLNLLFPTTVWYSRNDRAYIPAVRCNFRLARFSFIPSGELFNEFSKLVVCVADQPVAN